MALYHHGKDDLGHLRGRHREDGTARFELPSGRPSVHVLESHRFIIFTANGLDPSLRARRSELGSAS